MMFGRVSSGALALALAAVSLGAARGGEGDMRGEAVAPSIVKTTLAVYSIVQGGSVVGKESVTRETFNDNTVVFRSAVEMTPNENTRWDETTELVLDDESYFPRSYSMKKTMVASGRTIEQSIDVEMVTNVAVVKSRVAGVENTRNHVLPAGTSMYELGVMHLFHQMLFWYDRESAGRQSFRAFDIARGNVDDFVLHETGRETVEVNDESFDVSVFSLESRTLTQRYFVDAHDRIIRVEYGYAVYELIEWSEQPAGEG